MATGVWHRTSAALVLVSVIAAAACAAPPRPPTPAWEPATGTARPIEGRAPRVLVVGDSIADQHGSHAVFALREMGIDAGLVALWGWGLFSQSQYDMGEPVANPPEGTLMYAATQAVADFDPDIVALYSNHNYWQPYPRDAAGAAIQLGTAAFDEMVREQLGAFMERMSASGAVVYLIKPMPAAPGTTAADNVIWASYLRARDTLGFGIINAGDVLATASGEHVQSLADCHGIASDVRPSNDLHLTYYGAGLMGTVTARALAGITNVATGDASAPADTPAALVASSPGYRIVTCDGATFQLGDTGAGIGGHALGDTRASSDAVVAATNAGPGDETLLLTAGGKVLPLGGAVSYGDASGLDQSRRAVGIAPTASYNGYWIATSDGQVQAFGDAARLGGLVGEDQTVSALAATPDRTGYWLLTTGGRVAAFGTAAHLGDLAASPPVDPAVGIAPNPLGGGYWILDRAGNVYPFGAAANYGTAANQDFLKVVGYDPDTQTWITEPVPASEHPTHAVAILPSTTGNGYYVALANGGLCHFGDAVASGGIHRTQINFFMIFLGHEFYGPGDCSQFSEESEQDTLAIAEEALAEAVGDDIEAAPPVPVEDVPSDVDSTDDGTPPPIVEATEE